MDARPPLTICSFVIRFVAEGSAQSADAGLDEPQRIYRGAIRHVQTDAEINFRNWQEAVAFIQRYVPLDALNSDESPPGAGF